jgi:membrane associated rhomboid family serine protease
LSEWIVVTERFYAGSQFLIWMNGENGMGGLVPLNDATRSPARIPAVTATIILVNCFVFLLELAGGDAFVTAWSAVPVQLVSGHHWITLITSMFLHGSWLHIIGNMIFLWAFGPEIEDAMGRWRYLLFYFSGGLVAMISQVAANPHSAVPNLGASGAIAAVMGAFLVTYPRDRIRSVFFLFIFVRITFIPAVVLIGFWFLSQLLNAGSVADVQAGGVAYLAHIGGFAFGALTARLFEDPRRVARQQDVD